MPSAYPVFSQIEKGHPMELSIQLDKMTTVEKLAAIETIWQNLIRSDEEVPSPSWHKDVIGSRQTRVAEGISEFHEWSESKARIRSEST